MERKQQIYEDVYRHQTHRFTAEVGVQSAEDREAAVGRWEPVALPIFCEKNWKEKMSWDKPGLVGGLK